MPAPELTEAMIDALDLAPGIYERGRAYDKQGLVLRVTQRGDTLLAEVEGSDIDPYAVYVRLGAKGITETACSCPYTEEWGGVCKHVVAVLLTALHRRERVAQRTPIAELVAGLDADRLRQLVVQLAEQVPTMADVIEELLSAKRRSSRR